jgi:hypothetical protein
MCTIARPLRLAAVVQTPRACSRPGRRVAYDGAGAGVRWWLLRQGGRGPTARPPQPARSWSALEGVMIRGGRMIFVAQVGHPHLSQGGRGGHTTAAVPRSQCPSVLAGRDSGRGASGLRVLLVLDRSVRTRPSQLPDQRLPPASPHLARRDSGLPVDSVYCSTSWFGYAPHTAAEWSESPALTA